MIHYRDKTFCGAPCQNTTCHRLLTEEIREKAEKWWGGPDAPMSISDFSSTCSTFQPKETK